MAPSASASPDSIWPSATRAMAMMAASTSKDLILLWYYGEWLQKLNEVHFILNKFYSCSHGNIFKWFLWNVCLAAIHVLHNINSRNSMDILVCVQETHWTVIFTRGWAYWILSIPIHPFQNAPWFMRELCESLLVNLIVIQLYLLMTMVRIYLKPESGNVK